MVTLAIRKLDEPIKAQLRIQAARHGRSTEEETRMILRDAIIGRCHSRQQLIEGKSRSVGAEMEGLEDVPGESSAVWSGGYRSILRGIGLSTRLDLAASALEICSGVVFLQQRSVVRRLGTNDKGMAGTVRLFRRKMPGLKAPKG